MADIKPQADNDFIIDAEKPYAKDLPCVLPTDKNNDDLNFMEGKWLDNYHKNVPFIDALPLEKRVLPNQSHIQYPYLTISDFLEPYLSQLPFPINSEKFFDGNYKVTQGPKDHSYILPVKKLFFKFFHAARIIILNSIRIRFIIFPLAV